MKEMTKVATEAKPRSRYAELKRMLEERRREIQAEVQGKMRDVRSEGAWGGKQVIPRAWVEKSFSRQVRRGSGADEFYGYLFWGNEFQLGGKAEEVFYATGNGGNKVFVFKHQPLVIVVTATAYGQWYMHQQVGSMMERYILPALSP